MFRKEDQKYNIILYINEEENLTLKEVLLDKLNFSVRSLSKMKRYKTVKVNNKYIKPSGNYGRYGRFQTTRFKFRDII